MFMVYFRNVFIGLVASAVLAGAVVSCGGGSGGYDTPAPPATAATVIRSASLNGAQAGTGSTGTGRGAVVVVVVNPTTIQITGGVTFTGLTTAPTGAHIHRLNGTIAIGLVQAADNATATIPAGTLLSSADYAELLAGYLYFNVHSSGTTGGCAPPANCANGEIRGQINLTTPVVAGLATLNGAQETPPIATIATGRGTVVVDPADPLNLQILIGYVTYTVTNETVAHIHTGAPGASGPANVVTLTLDTANNIATAPQGAKITPQNLTDLSAGGTYFNVHSSNTTADPTGPCAPPIDCTKGEIRGQIVIQ
jgi:hypothetical protein